MKITPTRAVAKPVVERVVKQKTGSVPVAVASEPASSSVATLARLSDPIAPKANPKVVSTAVAGDVENQVRVSLDYHNVLDVEFAGARDFNGIRSSCLRAIQHFLQQSVHNRIGICSWIGLSGRTSQANRTNLIRSVDRANQLLTERGIPQNQLLQLKITSDKDKPEISDRSIDIHLDDKSSVIDAVIRNGVQGVLYQPRPKRGYSQVTTLEHFFLLASALTPRPHLRGFYQ